MSGPALIAANHSTVAANSDVERQVGGAGHTG